MGGEVEVVGFDFTELTKAKSIFFFKILLAADAPVAMTPAYIPVTRTAPNFTAGEDPLVLAILAPALKPATTAAPVPTLVNPLATESGTLKVELLILRVL